jgi:predicted CoA-binding protein
MEQAIQDFINGKRIAVVGVSRSGKKFGNTALIELKGRGYQVYPVHPHAEQIDGERCYPNLRSLQGKVDGVFVCVQPAQTPNVLHEAAQVGIKNVWLQQGAESPEALTLAKELGLNTVSKRCLLMYAMPVRSFHAWHRGFVRLFGKL